MKTQGSTTSLRGTMIHALLCGRAQTRFLQVICGVKAQERVNIRRIQLLSVSDTGRRRRWTDVCDISQDWDIHSPSNSPVPSYLTTDN